MSKFERHLRALLLKNLLLKRRHPCSFFCELFLAIGSTGLLALARALTSNVKAFELDAKNHVEMSMPTRLPDCTEYVAECNVQLVEDVSHSAVCAKGVTFGCKAAQAGDVPGVWVSMGCFGTFKLAEESVTVPCHSGRYGKLKVCWPKHRKQAITDPLITPIATGKCANHVWLGHSHDGPRGCIAQMKNDSRCSGTMFMWALGSDRRCGCATGDCKKRVSVGSCQVYRYEGHSGDLHGFGHSAPSGRRLKGEGRRGLMDPTAVFRGLLTAGDTPSGMRRLSAQFGIAPADGGGREFRDWLVANGHPWADHVRLFDSSDDVQRHVTARDYPERDLDRNRSSLLCAAIVFETSPLSEEVRYTLRFNRSLGNDPNLPALNAMMMATRIKTDTLVDKSSDQGMGQFNSMGMAWYTQSGFLSIQRTVDSFLGELGTGRIERTGSTAAPSAPLTPMGSSMLGEDGRPHIVVPFPTPAWKRDMFSLVMPSLLAAFLLISLAYSVNRMITAVVHEREVRLRDGMRMMGMHPAAFYVSWILTYLLIYVFVSVGVVICLTYGGILPNSSPSLLFFWLMLFAAASISYALAITSFFNKAKTAATVGSIAFYASSYLVHLGKADSSQSFLCFLSLCPPVCFGFAARCIAQMESNGVGITWANIAEPSTDQRFSVLIGFSMLAADAVVLFLVFLYLDQIMPREVGLRRPWHFPFSMSFWRELRSGEPSDSSRAAQTALERRAEVSEVSALVEQDVGEAAAAMARNGQIVELRGLSKYFGELQAVRSLELVMYPGEIFALLGHNGAGKTTTLAMLCGLMPPTYGSCVVFGHDNAQDPAQVQRILGVCPQHDVLWEELDCEEHLRLFGVFKGVPSESLVQEASAMLQQVGLKSARANITHAGHLSGGMKRKLSLGIAFLGGSQLVVLDEPTSGLDPYSRRMVWELLRTMKQGRVTVLSTHYMDEADILGDRIAILHEGRLKCCGSPQFLKRAYDCGYNITFVKRAGCETGALREAVCRHMPELASQVFTLSDSGNELMLQFPFAAARHFPKVLTDLEHHLDELCIESYGVSVTTLEEVFLKVASGEVVGRVAQGNSESEGERSENEYIELQELPGPRAASEAREVCIPSGNARGRSGSFGDARSHAEVQEPLKDTRLAVRQFRALLLKRWRYGLRDKKGLLCQLFLPSGTLIMLLLMMSAKLFHSMPPLELSAHRYNEQCPGTPQNLVDYSHLASVDPSGAEAMLASGRPFWKGELRHFAPWPEDDNTRVAEEVLTSDFPGFVTNVLRPAIKQVLASKLQAERESRPPVWRPARRLQETHAEGTEAAVVDDLAREAEAHFLHSASEAWGAWALAHSTADAVATQFSDSHGGWGRLARRLMPAEELQPNGSAADVFMPFGSSMAALEKLDNVQEGQWGDACRGITLPEIMLWGTADRDHDGLIKSEEAKDLLRELVRGVGRSRGQELSNVLGVNGTLDGVLEQAFLLAADQDRDNSITMEEYCNVTSVVRDEVKHVYHLAAVFSKQILKAPPSPCPRYGAYYVVRSPRNASSATFAASSDAVIFVNTTSSHASSVFQAALTNARFSRLNMKKRVVVTTHPFPQTQDEQNSLERVATFLLCMYISFCLSFIPAGIVHFVVKERATGARQLQVLSGAPHLSYWLSNLTYDLALYAVAALCIPFSLRQFGFNMLLVGDCGKAVACVLCAFGPAVAGFSYVVTFLFKDHSKASNTVLTFCLVGASVLSTVLFILNMVNYNPSLPYPSACEYPTPGFPEGNCNSRAARTADKILGPLFRLVPTVCVYQALFTIACVATLRAMMPQGAMDAMLAAAGDQAPHVSTSPFAYEWAGEPLIYLIVEAFVYFGATVLLDAVIHNPRVQRSLDAATFMQRLSGWRVARFGGSVAQSSPLMDTENVTQSNGDFSVETERERAALVSPEDIALHVWHLEKFYKRWLALRTPAKRAVRGVSFAVHGGEVFGLLGHNGAGKTSALKCLIGEQCCTAGTVHIGGFNMQSETGKARRRIGYCPQFDAHLELLTVQDHLDLFSELKGLPRTLATQARHTFGLEKIVHRRADVLSGGNKRKLSAAIALIGNPTLAVLDEPSCGLDPAARRVLWGAVHTAVAGATALPGVGRNVVAPSAVLLTTHSMEEAEALSTRLGILAEGLLLTVGTAQQIKQRRGRSHELALTLLQETESNLATALHRIGGATLRPETPMGFQDIATLLEADSSKKGAYSRARCVVRAQIETLGHVEASVLAEWWLQQERGAAIQSFLCNLAGEGVELAENFGLYWRFRLPHGGVSLSKLFGELEEHGKELGISEYTLTQATLEQIFNAIAQDVTDELPGDDER